MAIESTLLIVKPDGVRRGLVGEVLRRVEAKGLTIERAATCARSSAASPRSTTASTATSRSSASSSTSSPAGRSWSRRSPARTRSRCWRTLMGPTEPGRGAARLDPRRLRHADRREHRARLRLAGLGRARARSSSSGSARGRGSRRRSTGSALALEHHLDGVARRRRWRSRSPTARRSSASSCRGLADVAARHARPPRDAVPDRLDLEVVRRDRRAPGGGGGPPRPARVGQRDPAVARAPGAVRPDHDAPPDDPHGRPARRHGGRADAVPARCTALRTNPATTAPGERFWYSNDGVEARRRVPGGGDRRAGPRAAPRRACSDRSGCATRWRRSPRTPRTDLAIGYEPLFTDRPAQLRHPLVPAHRIVSNTADGSIISNVLDMSAYARLLLHRGDVPGHDGQRMLSDEASTPGSSSACPTTTAGRYGYGLWTEDVDGVTWIAHTGGMVGYTALLAVSPADGLGCVVLQNGYGSRAAAARARGVRVRARGARRRGASRAVVPPAPDRDRERRRLRGHVHRRGRPRLRGRGRARRAAPRRGAGHGRLERDPLAEPGDGFLVPHEALERYALIVRSRRGRRRRGGVPRRHVVPVASATRAPSRARSPRSGCATPGSTGATTRGRRRCGWSRARAPLAISWPNAASDEAEDEELVPLADGWFAAGAERDPRRIRFLGNGARGKAVRRRVQRGLVVPLVRGLRTGGLAVERAERDARVLPAEPERVRQRERDVEVARLVRRDVEVAVGIGRRVVDRRRDPCRS